MADKYKLLDLFSGIGGFSLGLERSGAFETVAFCEIEPFCRSVLKKHWPEVPIYEDVKTLSAKRLGADGITVDAICGGFPCQDISVAGQGAGLAGERSGLWFEYHRLIKEIRPKIAIIENVSALRSRGLDKVLWSLAEIGYDAEWHCIPASAVGAPHQRDRIWIVAYANGAQCERRWVSSRVYSKYTHTSCKSWWKVEPNVGRVVNGVPSRVDRLRSLGNAVVPQIPEMIGLAIAAAEKPDEDTN
jgi:DNA (cytosine-5)-methyltransferase 1